jgi:hypothetical protein
LLFTSEPVGLRKLSVGGDEIYSALLAEGENSLFIRDLSRGRKPPLL